MSSVRTSLKNHCLKKKSYKTLQKKKRECLRYPEFYKEGFPVNLHSLTIHEIQELLAKKEVSILDLTQDVLDQIDKFEDKINAFTTLTKEQALERAQNLQEKMNKGEDLGPL